MSKPTPLPSKIKELITSESLTDTETSLLLYKLSDIDKSVALKLSKRLLDQDNTWIKQDKLHEVIIRLLALYKFDPSFIDGSRAAFLAQRLLSEEIKPGGPYKSSPGKSILTNTAIAQLFQEFGKPLPNIAYYLSQEIDNKSTVISEFESLLLYWPHAIFTGQLDNRKINNDLFIKKEILQFIKNTTNNPGPGSQNDESTPNAIEQHVMDEISKLNYEVAKISHIVWKEVVRVDTSKEASMLSTFFAQSLKEPFSNKIDGNTLVNLGVANFFAWMAYALYDDFIDEEGKPIYVPTANIAHRKAILLYASCLKKDNDALLHELFDLVDSANLWEVLNCRLAIDNNEVIVSNIPDYGEAEVIAERALGHVLGPLIISSRITKNAEHLSSIRKGLKHYLIARQYNDDAHDWMDDLSRGHVSLVVAHLLRANGFSEGKYSLHEVNMKLKKYFWEQGLEEVSRLTLHHINEAKKNLESTGLFKSRNIFYRQILNPIVLVAKKGLSEHLDQKEFLKTYSETTSQ